MTDGLTNGMRRRADQWASDGHGAGAALLWQGAPEDAPPAEKLMLWEGSAASAGARSLTEYLDEHGEELRRKYLAWSHDLGLTRIMGRPLRERFVMRGAGSLWPLSLFVEQSTWNQHSLEKILKVLAFERWLAETCPGEVRFAGADADLSRVLRALCRQRGIRYAWRRLPRASRGGRRALRRLLPHFVRGLAAQAYFLLTRLRLPRPPAADGTRGPRVLICAPFFNHNADRQGAGEFTSRYWTALPQLLVAGGWRVHWLHLFYPHERIPNAREAARVLQRIQHDSPDSGSHSFVESYLPLGAFLGVFVHWCRFGLESLWVGLCLRMRFVRAPRESFWPLLRHDWASAFRGVDCVSALIYSAGFDSALRCLPHQDEGIFLMENQGWERALARAWNAHGHGRLAGVAHSTIRFWDLRYHCDPRRYEPHSRRLLPAPGVVILNGRVARGAYLATCALREPLVDCEALRYLHLTRGTPRALERTEGVRLLVLGDFLHDSTERLLALVACARECGGGALQVWVKPHPNCPVDLERHAGLGLRVVAEPVPQLVPLVHLVLASNTTSAAVDAYVGGGRILVYDDRRGVNLSPLRELDGVAFVHDALDLARAIAALRTDGAGRTQQPAAEFFNIDPRLARWREHFGLAATAAADCRP